MVCNFISYFVLTVILSFTILAGSSHAVAPAPLPQTGQMKCYNATGAEIDCDGTGQDGDTQAGVAWPNPRFAVNNDSTITDSLTGLMWTENANAPGPVACKPAVTKKWQDAMDYAECLNSNNYLGYNDWRIPNVLELKSLVDLSQASPPLSAGHPFGPLGHHQQIFYWSSTARSSYIDNAWGVDLMESGGLSYLYKGASYNVWPVRTALPANSVPAPTRLTGQTVSHSPRDDGDLKVGVEFSDVRFTDNNNGTITDNLTGLIWLKNTNCFAQRSWVNALASANTLSSGACGLTDGSKSGDWQLPNYNEMLTLIDFGSSTSPSLPSGHPFINLTYQTFWTSDTDLRNPVKAWVFSGFGSLDSYAKADQYGNGLSVWPVRRSALKQKMTVTKSGDGSGMIIPNVSSLVWNNNIGSAKFANDTTVILTADPQAWSKVLEWNGCDDAVDNRCTVAMASAKNISVVFGDIFHATITSVDNRESGNISFTANRASTFSCSLDNSEFTPCTSPFSFSTLADGEHFFSVVATDQEMNVSPAAIYSWVLNTPSPSILFSIPSEIANQNVPILLESSGNVEPAAAFCITEQASSGSCSWSIVSPKVYKIPTTVPISVPTTIKLYAFTKDFYGNITGATASVTITLTVSPQIVAGSSHVLSLKPDGTLWAWGDNSNGQLGDGTKSEKLIPVQIGNVGEWKAISAGSSHSLGIKQDGTLWAWGNNAYGQLGEGTTVEKLIPTKIGTDTDWKSTFSGGTQSFAIKNDGTLWTWGTNLGERNKPNKLLPVKIGTDTDWNQLATGSYHALAIKDDGTLWVWGEGIQLGLSSAGISQTSQPIQVGADNDNWKQVGAGYSQSYAIRGDGTLWVWGENNQGQLGLGDKNSRYEPIQVGSGSSWKSIFSSAFHVLATKNDGTLWTWGDNSNGALGDGTIIDHYTPKQIGMDTDWNLFATGDQFSIAVKKDGSIWSWGRNSIGQLGLGLQFNKMSPEEILLPGSWEEVTVGGNFVVARNRNGSIWSWGSNDFGQLGDGKIYERQIPNQVGTLSDWRSIAATSVNTYAIKLDGTLWGWGFNQDDRFNDGTPLDKKSPVRISSDTDWSQLSGGSNHSMAIKSDGSLWGWGINESYVISETGSIPLPPTQIGYDFDWKQVSAGSNNAFAIKKNGTLWAWGQNAYGSLGIGSDTSEQVFPSQIGADTDWKYVSTRNYRVLAIKNDGTLWTWGLNQDGGLGVGTTTDINSPRKLNDDKDWKHVSAGDGYMLALKQNGSLWAWGNNYSGQLGNGTTTNQFVPAQIGTSTDWKNISAGGATSVAIKNDGSVWAWGQNWWGALGNGDSWRDTPQQIPTILSRIVTPAISTSQTIPVIINAGITATDYCLQETSTTLGCAWVQTAPTTYRFNSSGAKVLYAWAKDSAGNISPTRSSQTLIDTMPPSVTIVSPLNHSSQTDIWDLDAVASDNSSIAAVEFAVSAIVNGSTYYLSPVTFTFIKTNTPIWLNAIYDEWFASWVLDTQQVNWSNDKTYTVTARATDALGNTATTTSTFSKIIVLPKDPSTISLDLSATSIQNGDTITASGKLSRFCSSGACNLINLKDRTVTLTITAPDKSISTVNVQTTDIDGHFASAPINGFDLQGTYTIAVSFEGYIDLQSSSSAIKSVLVGKPAGYAIIIEGMVTEDQAGIPSHTKSARRAYQTLKERNFSDDNIFWFNQGQAIDPTTNATLTVDDTNPTFQEIANLISGTTNFTNTQTLVQLMNSNPAPIYIVMIDHGSKGKFHLGNETITPEILDSWLAALDSKLDADGLAEKKIIVIGACYSGSFTKKPLSASGRVIITSASDGEQSYRGGYDGQDGVQSGEYFLDEFFASLKRFSSIKTAFTEASEKTWNYTRKSSANANGVTPFSGAMQHPLLDDTGNGGSAILTDITGGNGHASASLYLGASPGVNSIADPADINTVSPVVYLSSSTSSLLSPLWVSAVNNGQVSSIYVELVRPTIVLNAVAQTITGQLTRPIDPNDRQPMTATNERFEYSGFNFPDYGKYEAYFYAIDVQTGSPSPSKKTVIYKDSPANAHYPDMVALVEPGSDGLITNPDSTSNNQRIDPGTTILFKWSQGSDPDGDVITYKLEVCTDSSFSQNCYVRDEIIYNSLLVGHEAGLQADTMYYWRVWTVDAYGKRTSSPYSTFKPKNTNSLPGYVNVFVFNAANGAVLNNLSISITGEGQSVSTTSTGVITLIPGSFSMTISAAGFETFSKDFVMESGKTYNVSAYVNPSVKAVCGQDDGKTLTSAPTKLCEPGTAINLTQDAPWSWTCNGLYGGDSVTCGASLQMYSLTVSVPSAIGSGDVQANVASNDSTPVIIFCPKGDCTAQYNYGKSVRLTASPDPISLFNSWDGVCDATNPCDVFIDANKFITAHFVRDNYFRIARSSTSEDILNSLLLLASDGVEIRMLATDIAIGLQVINKNISLSGGWRALHEFQAVTPSKLTGTLIVEDKEVIVKKAVVNGTIIVKSGKLIMDGVTISQ